MGLANMKWRFVCWIVACQFGILSAPLPLQAEKTTIPATEQKSSSTVDEPEGVVGRAYYYAKRYKGRRTSSGATYKTHKLTAAHPTLPFGTRVKVENITNKRSVVVTVNDRCRKRSFEFIDLSHAAARELGFLGKGTARVRITTLH
jgi:rare lipoprotein A